MEKRVKHNCKLPEAKERSFDFERLPREHQNGLTLVIYNYYHANNSVNNFKFFLAHGLHERQDTHFLFVLSNDPCLDIPVAPNVAIVVDSSGCYGFGAIKSAIDGLTSVEKYEKFIFVGSWVKGPFMPTWSTSCWTDAFTSLLDNQHHVSGTTLGCATNEDGYANKRAFLSLTAWASVRASVVPLFSHTECRPHLKHEYKAAQTRQFHTLKEANFGVAVLSSSYENDPINLCRHEWEFRAHPHETIFVNPRLTGTLKQSKFVNRDVEGDVREYKFLRACEIGMDEGGYDSRKFCPKTV